MDLCDCIETFDTLHIQVDAVSIIAGQKVEYVDRLKENQAGLLEVVSSRFTDQKKEQIAKKCVNYYKTSEKSHNQDEIRRFYRLPVNCGKETWAGLRSFICFEKYTCSIVIGAENTEQRFYITSLNNVTLASQAIRDHWEQSKIACPCTWIILSQRMNKALWIKQRFKI